MQSGLCFNDSCVASLLNKKLSEMKLKIEILKFNAKNVSQTQTGTKIICLLLPFHRCLLLVEK